MKPRLTVLLAAGSTLRSGIGPKSSVPGMPSTRELTDLIANLKFPAALRFATPYFIDDSQKEAFGLSHSVAVLPMINHILRGAFDYVDFETILHALEQLDPFVSGRDSVRQTDQFHAVLSAFAEVRRNVEFLCDRQVLNAARQEIIKRIYSLIINRVSGLGSQTPALHPFLQKLDGEFQISVFTLNYDDVIDSARSEWFDGFTKPEPGPTAGGFYTVCSFDSNAFLSWRDTSNPLLAHLHGSVRFGYRLGIGLAKFSKATEAAKSLEILVGDSYRSGQIVSATPIISGLSKVAKLSYNPEPFGYYYRAFIDSIVENCRLLVVGYGGRDEHFNTWIEQFTKIHGDNRRVGWVSMLPAKDAFENNPDKQIISTLSGGKFERARHCHEEKRPEAFHACGFLGLVPSGFPMNINVEQELIDFLLGNPSSPPGTAPGTGGPAMTTARMSAPTKKKSAKRPPKKKAEAKRS
jgi:hypothetical protein